MYRFKITAEKLYIYHRKVLTMRIYFEKNVNLLDLKQGLLPNYFHLNINGKSEISIKQILPL